MFTRYNYSYYPVIYKTEKTCLEAISILEANQISPRRYFYPSLNKVDYVSGQSCPVAEDIATRILCLPLYYELDTSQISRICDCIKLAQ